MSDTTPKQYTGALVVHDVRVDPEGGRVIGKPAKTNPEEASALRSEHLWYQTVMMVSCFIRGPEIRTHYTAWWSITHQGCSWEYGQTAREHAELAKNSSHSFHPSASMAVPLPGTPSPDDSLGYRAAPASIEKPERWRIDDHHIAFNRSFHSRR